MKIKDLSIKIFITTFLLIGILPALTIGNYDVPIQYFLLPLFLYVFVFIMFKWIKTPRIVNPLILFWLLIIFEVFISGIFGSLYKFGVFQFPADTIQYVIRFLTLIFFVALLYNIDINYENLVTVFTIVLLLGMIIGILQWIDWSGNKILWELYTFSEQHYKYINYPMHLKRVPGIAHFATSNGGIAAFTFIVSYVAFTLIKKRSYRIIFFITMLFAIANTIASQARAGYLTIIFSFVVLYCIWFYLAKNKIKISLKFISIIGLGFTSIYMLYQYGNKFVVQNIERWPQLFEQVQAGGNRWGQIIRSIKSLEAPYEFIIGVSRIVQRGIGYIEVEPVNVLVMYGSLGFILQYFMIAFILVYLIKQIKIVQNNSGLLALVISSFTGLLSYQFFSVGYYFFREMYIGLFPWILIGMCIGAVERYKQQQLQLKDVEGSQL